MRRVSRSINPRHARGAVAPRVPFTSPLFHGATFGPFYAVRTNAGAVLYLYDGRRGTWTANADTLPPGAARAQRQAAPPTIDAKATGAELLDTLTPYL